MPKPRYAQISLEATHFLKSEALSQTEQRLLDKTVEEWRKRLIMEKSLSPQAR